MSETVRVELGARSYEIRIGAGLIEQAGNAIGGLRPGARCMIVTDTNVDACHGAKMRASLDEAGIDHQTVVVAPGEASKSFAIYQRVVEAILEARLERNDLVIALGGGVVGDLAGFAAATVRRGMDFVQASTSCWRRSILRSAARPASMLRRAESRRRLPPARAGAGRHGGASDTAAA